MKLFIIMNNYHKGQEAEEIKSQTSQTRLKSFYPELYFNLNIQSYIGASMTACIP